MIKKIKILMCFFFAMFLIFILCIYDLIMNKKLSNIYYEMEEDL